MGYYSLNGLLDLGFKTTCICLRFHILGWEMGSVLQITGLFFSL